MAKKTPFTPASIDAFCARILDDPLTPGLAIELLPSGKKRWRYRRRVAGRKAIATVLGGLFPAQTIAAAREWARELSEHVEAGVDPREARREEKARAEMTVGKAHELYMEAVQEGRASRARRKNKPRPIADKLEIYQRDVAPRLGWRSVYEITERDLIRLVTAKGKVARVRANRLAAELKVFFGWAASLRGLEVGLENDPSRRLGDLKFPESPRQRKLSLEEIEWFLRAVAEEEPDFRRGMLLWLLTAARISEVCQARRSELVNGIWTIASERVKNSCAHSIALGPWGRSLMATDSEWVFPAVTKDDRPRNRSVWYKARDRVLARMSEIAGKPIERFTPHDFRRTARSNTKRLKVDFETAEAMMNHLKSGMERIYDGYELEEEKAAWFHKWEQEVAAIAKRAGVAEALGVPDARGANSHPSDAITFSLPQGPGLQPRIDFGSPEPRAVPVFAQTAAKFVFAGEAWKPGGRRVRNRSICRRESRARSANSSAVTKSEASRGLIRVMPGRINSANATRATLRPRRTEVPNAESGTHTGVGMRGTTTFGFANCKNDPAAGCRGKVP